MEDKKDREEITFNQLPDILYDIDLGTNFEMIKSWDKKESVEPKRRTLLRIIKWIDDEGSYSVWSGRDHYFSGFSSLDLAIQRAEKTLEVRRKDLQIVEDRIKKIKEDRGGT